MGKQEIPSLTAAELARLIVSRQVSPTEVAYAFLDRIEAVDPRVHAYITLCREETLQAAQEAERSLRDGKKPGPLFGIPFAVKDQLMTRGIRTTSGSKPLSQFVPQEDATPVARLKQRGAILLGKLNMTQFAMGGGDTHPYGEPRNPWNLDYNPGVSSSGSGIAVAASMAAFTLGEDTGGSIRGPAAWCGIVGLRPSWGLVSRHGLLPACWSMDTAGPMTRTVEDCALVLEVIAGYDPRDPLTRRGRTPRYTRALDGNIRGVRIGLLREFMEDSYTHAEVKAAVAKAAEALKELGAAVEECSIPLLAHATAVLTVLADSDGAFVHREMLRKSWQDYGPVVRRRILAASLIPAEVYHRATRLRALIREEMEKTLREFDLLISPTQLMPPAKLQPGKPVTSKEEAAALFIYRRGAMAPPALAGGPAISVPCGFTADSLPIGLQIAGRPFGEPLLLKVAHAYQQATDWHTRHPPV